MTKPPTTFQYAHRMLTEQINNKIAADNELCPECSTELTPQSGCVICMQCGWSLCSN